MINSTREATIAMCAACRGWSRHGMTEHRGAAFSPIRGDSGTEISALCARMHYRKNGLRRGAQPGFEADKGRRKRFGRKG